MHLQLRGMRDLYRVNIRLKHQSSVLQSIAKKYMLMSKQLYVTFKTGCVHVQVFPLAKTDWGTVVF